MNAERCYHSTIAMSNVNTLPTTPVVAMLTDERAAPEEEAGELPLPEGLTVPEPMTAVALAAIGGVKLTPVVTPAISAETEELNWPDIPANVNLAEKDSSA